MNPALNVEHQFLNQQVGQRDNLVSTRLAPSLDAVVWSSGVLRDYLSKQLSNLFPIFVDLESLSTAATETALARTLACLGKIKCFSGHFDPLVSWQYAIFLYMLGNQIWKSSPHSKLPTLLFLLNKALNGIDLFFEIDLPRVFVLGHTVGLVYAKATYGEYCVFHQNCTVGRNGEDRPVLEEGVILYPGSSIIGRCLVRENTVLSPGVQLINTETPGNCIVFLGSDGKPTFKEAREYYADRYIFRGTGKLAS